MPSSPNYKRDYQQEAKYYKNSEVQRKKMRARKKARYQLEKEGRVRLGDMRDVDHKNTNALDNRKSNLRVVSRSENRSFARNKNAGKKK